MKTVFVTFATLLLCASASAQDADKLFADVRAALAARNLNRAAELLKTAETTLPAESTAEFERLEDLHNYSNQFWQSVWKGASTLRGTDELEISSTRVAVVESRGDSIVLRVAGQNKTYTTENMPAALALKLASLALKVDAPENLVIVGAFLAVDAKGDKEKAAAYWKKASEGGVDTADLQDELATVTPRVSTTDIPTLTPALRVPLKAENWKILQASRDKSKRLPLGEAGANNEEGRLLLHASADESIVVAYQRGYSANVSCQMVLADLSGNELFVFHVDGAEPVEVQLPAGAVLLEFARQRGEVRCQLNGEPVDLGEAVSRGAGYLSVKLPAGGKCVIAAFLAR